MRRITKWLPAGRPLAPEVWASRHRLVCWMLWAHVPFLFTVGVLSGHSAIHSLSDVTVVAAAAAFASWPSHSRRVRSVTATLGAVTCSALLVHFTHGTIEMHFHFFVMVGVISLYQDWVPFLVALGFVVLHHGVMGAISPQSVYDHPAAQRNPWLWAAIHGAFVLAASAVNVVAWRLNEDQALKDPLTKMANRTLFFDRLEQALARRARYSEDVVLLVIDLDRFKDINDTRGHPVGDQILIEVSHRIASVTRNTDTAARLGGDEFAVVLPSAALLDGQVIADRILREIRQPLRVDGNELFVNASIGMIVVDDDSSIDDVVRNADLALYMAKASGAGQVECFQADMRTQALERAQLEVDLRSAIAAGEIDVYYQPTVTVEDSRVVGFEALARWNHPTRGMVPPNTFIPLAETAGLIKDLGLSVLSKACEQAALWREHHPAIEISVNVSPLQLADDEFAAALGRVLARTGLDPYALILEITESVLMQDAEVAIARLHGLRQLGVRIAIDDFGTGHSSLSYLRRFPIDVLKIDKSFIDGLPGRGAELAATIVRLGQLLRLDVVAEGVEAEGQRLELRSLGCTHAQGFLFAAALPADEIEPLLCRQRDDGRHSVA